MVLSNYLHSNHGMMLRHVNKKKQFFCFYYFALVGLFAGVWGAGTETTKQWFAQGFRTLDDLRTRARLTRTQQIGLKYYNDFNTRIPREEVTRIETIVS
jgi:hypothetical protein